MAHLEGEVRPAPSRLRYLIALPFAIVGYFSGGMIGVGVAKAVSSITGCTPVDGFPACNFEPYLQVGSMVGLLLLPGVILWRLVQSEAAYRNSERG